MRGREKKTHEKNKKEESSSLGPIAGRRLEKEGMQSLMATFETGGRREGEEEKQN